MPIMVHRRRPAFEAIQYQPGVNCDEVSEFIGRPVHAPGECDPLADLVIPPWGGEDTAHPGDWVLRDRSGQLSLCRQAVFDMIYEPA